jgi:hypothetical protein
MQMKDSFYLIVSGTGVRGIRKTKPALEWDELCIKANLEIPDEFFQRPLIEANIQVKDVPNVAFNPQIILNTKELIEKQTGAKINFRIVKPEDEE